MTYEWKRETGTITDIFLGIQDHGIYSCVLTVNYGHGCCQGFGCHNLNNTEYRQFYLKWLCEALEVDSIEKAKGMRVECMASMCKISHIMKENGTKGWFFPEEILGKWKMKGVEYHIPKGVEHSSQKTRLDHLDIS